MGNKRYLDLVKEITLSILGKEEYTIFLFGSRIFHPDSSSSDVDVGILGKKKVPLKKLYELRTAIENSIVPFHVDFVDFKEADPHFTKLALKDVIIWNQSKSIFLDGNL